MDKASGRLTVFFEEPFWICEFERIPEGKAICMQDYVWGGAGRLRDI